MGECISASRVQPTWTWVLRECCTTWATSPKLLKFSIVTEPNLVNWSPSLRPCGSKDMLREAHNDPKCLVTQFTLLYLDKLNGDLPSKILYLDN